MAKFNITRAQALTNALAVESIDDDTRAVLENMLAQLLKNSASPRKRGKSDARKSNESDAIQLVEIVRNGAKVPNDGIGTGFVQNVLPTCTSGQKASAILRAGVAMGILRDITPENAKKSQPKRYQIVG